MGYLRTFTVHRVTQHVESSAECLNNSLKTEAHAEGWRCAVSQPADQLRNTEVFRPARTRRNQNDVRMQFVQHIERSLRAIRVNSRTGLARIIREGMNEAVVVVHEQQLHAFAYFADLHCFSSNRRVR